MQRPDTIERQIDIEAPAERVFPLVCEPGWWIGDGDRSAQRHWREDDLNVVDDERYGRYLIRTVAVDPPGRVSFRCAFGYPGEAPTEGNSTLIEFTVAEVPGGTRVRVLESGIAALAAAQGWDDATWDRYVAGNDGGWNEQLGVLKERAAAVTA